MSRCDCCEECVERFNPVPSDEDEGQNDEPIAFSKKPCEMSSCEEWRAGERYIIHTAKAWQDRIHLEVCRDCYLKFHGVFEE